MSSFYFLFFIFYFLFVAAPPARATIVDLSPQPVFGETIEIQKEASRSSFLDDISGSIFGGLGNIGPKTDKLPFPDFRTEQKFFGDTEMQNRALPYELINKVSFEATAAVQAKLENRGFLAHVGCGKVTAQGQSGTDVLTNPGKTTFSASGEYGQTLLLSRFWQAIFVPDRGADLNFTTNSPSDPNIPEHFVDCLTSGGVPADKIDTQYSGPAQLNFVGDVLQNIKQFLLGFLNPGQSTAVNIKVQQVKYLPGETQLKDQTVGEHGFLNFFKPQEVPFSKQGDQKENIDYEVAGKTETKGVNYAGSASFKSGYTDLVRSLYPAELLPQPKK